jgi:choline dehydrogenase-like flavoprotein
MATKRLTLCTFAIVTDLVYDRDRRRARGVRVLDATTGQISEYSAPVIFLCASALNSTWVLLRSGTDVWPGGLGSSSGALGHNLMDHHFRCGANGEVEGHEGSYVYGRRPTGFYVPRFRNLPGDERRDYLRGFGYQGSASRQGWERAVAELGIGGAFKDAMTTPGPWRIGATAFGEMLPNHANRVWIDARTDKWGLPVLAIDCATGENERLMRRDMMNDMAEMLEAAGVRDVRVFDNDYAPGMGIHEMGTARMGRDPKTSVLNAHNQVWDCPNVFVTDGACMTSSACQNPSLTYMALTARAAAYAVEELKRGNL